MSDPSGRIAIDISATSNVAEVAKARSEVSALGDAAKKAADVSGQAWQRAGGSVMVYNTIMRQMAQETRTATVQVQALSVAVGQSESGGGLLGSTFRARSAFVGLAFAVDAFTRSADSGEGATRRVLRSLSLLAFTLGPEAGIIASIALSAGDAMVEMWARAEKAAVKAQEQFEKTLETISRGTLEGASRTQQYLYSGDPFARRGAHPELTDLQFRALSTGQLGLQREQQRLTQQITRDELTAADQRAKDRGKALSELPQLRMNLDAINAAYKVQAERVREAGGVTDDLMKKETERARYQAQRMREAFNRREAQRLRPEEVPFGPGIDLGELNRTFGITGAARGSEGVTGFGLPTGLLAQKGVDTSKIGGRIRPADIIPSQFMQTQEAMAVEITKLGDATRSRLGNTLADSLAAGITAGFRGGGIKGAFKAAGQTLLAGLGGIFIDLGKVYLQYSGIMQALTPLLGNPFTAGFAGAGIGAALLALGAALEGVGQQQARGGGGGAAYGNTFVPNAAPGGGGMTLIVQTVDPWSRAIMNNTAYELNRAQMLGTPVVAPYGRPS